MRPRKFQAFGLIEVIVVVFIISLITALSGFVIRGAILKARIATAKAATVQLAKGVAVTITDQGVYSNRPDGPDRYGSNNTVVTGDPLGIFSGAGTGTSYPSKITSPPPGFEYAYAAPGATSLTGTDRQLVSSEPKYAVTARLGNTNEYFTVKDGQPSIEDVWWDDSMDGVWVYPHVRFTDFTPASSGPYPISESIQYPQTSPNIEYSTRAIVYPHSYPPNYSPQTMLISNKDTLFAWVYVDPQRLPTSIGLYFYRGPCNCWWHGAIWGPENIKFGAEWEGNMGPIPPRGGWIRLDMPASRMGFTDQVVPITGALTMVYNTTQPAGARVFFDRIGVLRAP
jgi:type II secretory pathway pseudopilin PulG